MTEHEFELSCIQNSGLPDDIKQSELDRIDAKFKAYRKAQDERKARNLAEANTWIKVGEIGVDAGLCWIGDPCYVLALPHSKNSGIESLDAPKQLPKDLGGSWIEFVTAAENKQTQANQPAAQFNYDAGHSGLGVCLTNTGYGDGTYNVLILKNEEGRIKEAKIVFIEDKETE
jgi:hypothetical protein